MKKLKGMKMQLQVLVPEEKTVKFEADPLASFVVPIYDITPQVLKRCLLSLADQDYENMEVICVFDGFNAELKQIAQTFLVKGNFQILEIEHQGACVARNEGFKISKGEILSFFNSDYIAKPGMVRTWVDALKNNPDCGFVYGGYEMNTSQRQYYPSKDFSEYELNVANYIDCGFPLWRKYVVEWDKDCKSLQDWDFWIRVVKTHHVKGFYLGREYSFIAEMPRPKGLSHDSSNNWIDRVTYIKNKNHIPLRDVVVTSLGARNHGVEIAKMLGADFRDDTFYKPWDYKALYMIGFYIKPGEQGLNEHSRRLAWFKDNYPKAKRIIHFVGADIYWLKKFPYESLKYLAGALRISCDHILSENQSAHDELEEYGIPSEIVPIPSYTKTWGVQPLPKEFKVSVYLVQPGHGVGQSDFDKYCYEASLSIIRGMPDVKFTAYGSGAKDIQYPNLELMATIPRETWPDYVYQNSALLRLCRHDHNPMASNEFIMAGRDVISNITTLGARMIDTSGKHSLNEWDKFSEGFNTSNWPETKANIIRTIRQVKNQPYEQWKRIEDSHRLKTILDQDKYIETLRGLCK
jgi:glycosyltransferase involved in cell wall biosynthesis